MPPHGVSAPRRRRPTGRRARRLLTVGLLCAVVVVGVTGCSTPAPDPTTIKPTPTPLTSDPVSSTDSDIQLPDAPVRDGAASTGGAASPADRHAAPLGRRQPPSMRSLVVEHLRPVARSSSSWTTRSAQAGGSTIRGLWRGAADVVAAVGADDRAGPAPSPVGARARTGTLAGDEDDPGEERGGVGAMLWVVVFAGLLHALMLWSSIEDRRRQAKRTASTTPVTDEPPRAAWEDAVALIDARRAEGWQLPPQERSSQPAGVWRPDAARARAATSRVGSSSPAGRVTPWTTPARPMGTAVLPDDPERDVELSSRVVIWTAAERGR